MSIEPFRVLPGDDASCLNLYEPTQPAHPRRAPRRSSTAGRFAFQGSLAATDAERANPWLLLEPRSRGDGAVPVIADANSMTYVLHKQLGDDIVVDARRTAGPAAARRGARRQHLPERAADVGRRTSCGCFPSRRATGSCWSTRRRTARPRSPRRSKQRRGDLGADAVSTAERLDEFHAVENTYLSTFQTLGGLGLLVGTVGLAAVLLRNVLERRRELALLGAVGYGRAHIFAIVLAENALLLGWGLAAGARLRRWSRSRRPSLERGGAAAGGGRRRAAARCGVRGGLLSSSIATRAALARRCSKR